MPNIQDLLTLRREMMGCKQHKDQTILQHGEAVLERYLDLIGDGRLHWELPDWWYIYGHRLINDQPPAEVMSTYLIYHDCGKPRCRTVDADGRQHFPNHENVSADLWLSIGGSPQVAELMRHDMDMHRLNATQARDYPNMHLVAPLLCSALAELHANADMFGGLESTSFKIKFKQLSRAGSVLCHQLYQE